MRSQFKPLRGQAHVIGLGAEGARLPPQLLGEEIEPPSDRPAPVDQRPSGGDMGLEPVELLADVGLGREQDRLLVEAVLVEGAGRRHERCDALSEALAQLLKAMLASIAGLVEAADANPARRPEAVRERLAQSIRTLMESSRGFDENRLHQEGILLAAKADIREELDRLKTHVASARALIEEGGPIGRRLDFLAQELAREASTLCAKANDVSLTAQGLELRAQIEQFREQVQNVE